MTQSAPTFELARVKALVLGLKYVIRSSAQRGAGELGLREQDVLACVLSLNPTSFHKSMPSLRVSGLWQDVYRPDRNGVPLYIKLQLVGDRPEDLLVVISFKRR